MAYKSALELMAANLNFHVNASLSKAHGICLVHGYVDDEGNDGACTKTRTEPLSPGLTLPWPTLYASSSMVSLTTPRANTPIPVRSPRQPGPYRSPSSPSLGLQT